MADQVLSSYSKLDRALHKLAFHSRPLQDILGDIEDALFAGQWQDIAIHKPIFITSLPRAGTTIVLETLYRISDLATHTYRDMPFILTPVIWQRLSRIFRRTSRPRERAHGDGLAINEDSPEAFEEVVWKKHFPGHYHEHSISCWPDTPGHQEFESFFKQHMQKIIMLRRADCTLDTRYISKNNTNIARIGYIQSIFPDASFVVPVRHPVEQAISLLNQHRNLIKQHTYDAFSRKYMADIGHYEFGELHRAILFPGLAGLAENLVPDSLDYWLAYWIVAYTELAQHDQVCFLGFENLCMNAETSLNRLIGHLGLAASKEAVIEAARRFRPVVTRWQDGYSASQVLTEQALDCYQALKNLGPDTYI